MSEYVCHSFGIFYNFLRVTGVFKEELDADPRCLETLSIRTDRQTINNSRRTKSEVKMRHFVMVDFNKGINIIKHNFLKLFCIVGHSAGTVLHAAGGSSSAHARNMPANMRDPNYNFNAQHSINFFYFNTMKLHTFLVLSSQKFSPSFHQKRISDLNSSSKYMFMLEISVRYSNW